MDFVPALPSASRIGNKGLSGRTSGELAFLMGHHMVEHRADTIVRSLVPAVADLEGVYLAALTIGDESGAPDASKDSGDCAPYRTGDSAAA